MAARRVLAAPKRCRVVLTCRKTLRRCGPSRLCAGLCFSWQQQLHPGSTVFFPTAGFDRRTPRHVDATFAPPPDLALGGSAAAPPVQSQGAFVRGGQLGLGTKEAAAAAEQQPPRQQQQPQQHRAPSAHYSSAPKKASAAPALPDKVPFLLGTAAHASAATIMLQPPMHG